MADNNLFIKCPICERENKASTGGDKKVIACSKCEAPVYDTTRPLSTADIASYQALLKQWGEKYRKSDPDRLQRQITTTKEHYQRQSEINKLEEKITELQTEVGQRKEENRYLQESYDVAITQAQHHRAGLEKQKDTLQSDIESLQQAYKQTQNQYSLLQQEMAELIEQGKLEREKRTQYINSVLAKFGDKLKEAEAAKASANSFIENAISKLRSNEFAGDQEKNNDEKDATEFFDDKSKNVEETNVQPEITDDDSGNVAAISITEDTDEPSVNGSYNAISTASAIADNAIQRPEWIQKYNELTPEDARIFRENYGALRLTIPQNSLENQRVALDEAMPIFVEGLGSYWCIQYLPTGCYFLVLDRERFKFNNSNYESITVCYNFNCLNETQLKQFNPSKYDLNIYEITQPAEVVPIAETGEWRLRSRGWLEFQEKPTS